MIPRRATRKNITRGLRRITVLAVALGAGALLSALAIGRVHGFAPGAAPVANTQAPAAVLTMPYQPPAVGNAAKVAADMTELQKELEGYLAQQNGTYGVHVIDIASGRSFGINDAEVFPAASTFKLPMAIYILEQASSGAIDLNEQISYADQDWEEGTGILQDMVSPGDEYSVRELVDLAITHSDNIATNMLLRRFDRENVFAYERQFGSTATMFDAETVGATPQDMARFMQMALSSKRIANPELRQFLFDALTHTEFHDRVEGGVPNGVTVAHKIGTLPGVVNDVALVYVPKHTFIAAFYSKDVDETVAPNVIAEATSRIYQFELAMRTAMSDADPSVQVP